MSRFFSKRMTFFWLAVVLFTVKTYVSYQIEFNLGIKNVLQSFLLVINPISSAIIIFGLLFLFSKSRRAGGYLLTGYFLLTFLLYANVLYYRFFNDFFTWPTIFQAGNLGNMGGSITGLMEWHDVLYWVDFAFLVGMFLWSRKAWPKRTATRKRSALVLVAGVAIFLLNLGLAEADRPELLSRTFDRTYLVKYLGLYNYTVYDGIQSIKTSGQRALASAPDVDKIKKYTEEHYAAPNQVTFGKAQGKNIIKIHLESFQSFLINYKLNGQEVTPFLNSLISSKEVAYFDNFFHQTGQGKTADAELIMDNSLYGLPQGSAFSLKGRNTYQSAAGILHQKGNYTSAVMHGDYKTFWNRDEIYKSMGIDKFYDASYYDMTSDQVVNYGLKDKPFFKESISQLLELPQPFYAHLITLTNHFPFEVSEEDTDFQPASTGDGVVDRYFQTAHYLDESLQQFFTDLKSSGLYDKSIILIYGDHYGISQNHNKAMAKIMGKEITPFENAQLQRVPLMIHAPGVAGGVNHTYGGEIDVLPTLLHLVGIDSKDYIQFGTDLFSKDHDSTVAFRNGDFISPAYTNVDGVYYDNATGLKIEEPPAEAKEAKAKVRKELSLSDEVLYGDLLRFYKPKGWTKIDRNKYFYETGDGKTEDGEVDKNESKSEED
ncbi:LTA synthase family protein [Bacillus testis]|uniref:LTA synthase family protein n=1 Tax=Bacillus testis TaxID=1622072 RepID=UPI00067E6A27|nr:LTA synthase family protein [Bacillus testis]